MRRHRIVAARMIANRYDVTCSCGIRVEVHTAVSLVHFLMRHWAIAR